MSTRYDDRDDRDYDRDSAYYGQYNRRSSLDNTRSFGERAENRWGESRYGEGGRGREGQVPLDAGDRTLDTARDEIVDQVLAGDLSSSTRDTVAKASRASQAIALLLGSPEFQRR